MILKRNYVKNIKKNDRVMFNAWSVVMMTYTKFGITSQSGLKNNANTEGSKSNIPCGARQVRATFV
jgi:hypothetical protein